MFIIIMDAYTHILFTLYNYITLFFYNTSYNIQILMIIFLKF